MQRIDELIEQLKSPALKDRLVAAEALGRLGREAAPALRHLLDRYGQTDDAAEHDAVARALAQIDPGSLPGARWVRTARQSQESARAWARTLREPQALASGRAVLRAWDDAPELEPLEPVRELAALLVEDPGLLPQFMERLAASLLPDDLAEVLYLAAQKRAEARRVLEALQYHLDARVAAAAGRMCRRIEAEHALSDEGQQLLALAVEHPAVAPALIQGFVSRPRLRRRLGLVFQSVVGERPELADQLMPLLYSSDAEVVQPVARYQDAIEKIERPRAP
jgi:hypothetical protein